MCTSIKARLTVRVQGRWANRIIINYIHIHDYFWQREEINQNQGLGQHYNKVQSFSAIYNCPRALILTLLWYWICSVMITKTSIFFLLWRIGSGEVKEDSTVSVSHISLSKSKGIVINQLLWVWWVGMQCTLNNTKMTQSFLHTSTTLSINVILQNISIYVLNNKTPQQEI